MLRYSLNATEAAGGGRVGDVLDQGLRTADIYSEGKRLVNTSTMSDVIAALQKT